MSCAKLLAHDRRDYYFSGDTFLNDTSMILA